MKNRIAKLATIGAVAAMTIVPSMSFANGWRAQRDRNQWTNLAIGAGAIGVLGAIAHNDTVATLGLVGAGYSAYRADTVQTCNDWDRHDFRNNYRYDRDHDLGRR